MRDGRSGSRAAGPADRSERDAELRGLGRVLAAVYVVFAVAATSRAAFQIATEFRVAPLAYVLSAFAAVVYLAAAAGFASRRSGARRIAWIACVTELVGVLVVGAVSLALPEDFPDETVWSAFGRGYVFIPLVLPVLGLLWLRKAAPARPTSG